MQIGTIKTNEFEIVQNDQFTFTRFLIQRVNFVFHLDQQFTVGLSKTPVVDVKRLTELELAF